MKVLMKWKIWCVKAKFLCIKKNALEKYFSSASLVYEF